MVHCAICSTKMAFVLLIGMVAGRRWPGRDSVFSGQYALSLGSDLHPDGDRLVVTNWFTELRDGMGGN